MNAFEIKCKTKTAAMKLIEKSVEDIERKDEQIQRFTQFVSEKVSEGVALFCENIQSNEINFIALGTEKEWDCKQIEAAVKKAVAEVLKAGNDVRCNEMTVWDFVKSIRHADSNNYIAESAQHILCINGIDYFENNTYKVEQKIYQEECFDKEKAIKLSESILCDCSMTEELERIYSDKNPKQFKGHPVHYRICCSDMDAASEMVRLLVKALGENKRLCGSRVDRIYDITDGCYDEDDFLNVVKTAMGNTIVFDMRGTVDSAHGNYASAYEKVVSYFNQLIRKHCRDVLFIFLEDTENPGFSKSLLSAVQEYMNIVEIKEGKSNQRKAEKYLDYLVRKGELAEYIEDFQRQIDLKKNEYSVSELHKIYNKWNSECLSKVVYKSYADYKMEPVKLKGSVSEQKLSDLVGLDGVKNIVEQILATHVIDKKRLAATTKLHDVSKHMIFTGNPGSAKTTVARILAAMLKEEGVISSGNFVECGRADLVAKYVGWTAKQVRKLFRLAEGGILFIDEAYSLVDEAGSFGDEAINTIVQEMENFRDRVIVIFAGYPEKMKMFLEKNEGLRSRIAFYVDFPDYSVEELMQIMDVMLLQREYHMTSGARVKVEKILQEGVKQPDFGNGRFVRTVIEKAIMKQSVRLFHQFKGMEEIPKDDLLELVEDDLEISDMFHHEKRREIGFLAG